MPRDRSFPLLLLCFFLSGMAALIYQTAWSREFSFVFGTSELAIVTVLAAYMGGLAGGAALAGRVARRLTRPVLVYGLLELGIAIAALAVPLGIAASRWLYVALFGGLEALPDAGGLATSLFYLVCSFLILLVPTAMMGATLPLLARHAVREESQIGKRIGVLYAINTVGAVAGTVSGAFWLLPAIGLRATILAAAGVNALVFLAAWVLARATSPLEPAPEPAAPAAGEPSDSRARWILPLMLASGFVSFSYEVMWVRLVGHRVGGGTQAFSTMLASFLAGIAIGSAIASRLATTPRRSALGFGVAQLGIAGLSIAAFAAVNQMGAQITGFVEQLGVAQMWSDIAVCMATLFPAALCIGATFPFAVRMLARERDDAGPASARVYSWNTVGSIVGSVCAGFFLVPGLGFEGTLIFGAAINLTLALAAALLFAPRRPLLAAAAVSGAIALAVFPPSTPWALLRATSMVDGQPAWGQVTYLGVGRSSTVLVTDQRYAWGLRNNGLPEAGMPRSRGGANQSGVTRWLTLLPVLARPEARSLLLVGLGGGMAIEVVPESIERIDVIELEPNVLAANQLVAKERWRDPLSDPRVHVHLNDARNALLLGSGLFDVIVSQPSHPWAGGAANLYTHEFFQLVGRRLTPDGVFVQWIGLPFVDEELFRSLLAALADVFPHVQAYVPTGGAVLFLASNAPIDMARSVPRAIAAAPASFALAGINAPEDVTSNLLLDEDGVRELARGAAVNRDGHNLLQSRSGRLSIRESLTWGIDELIAPVDPLVGTPSDGTDVFALLRLLPAMRAKRVVESLSDPLDREIGEALVELEQGKRIGPRRKLGEALTRNPDHVEGRAALLRLSAGSIARGADAEEVVRPPLSDVERALAAGWVAQARDPRGEGVLALDSQLAAVPLQHPLGVEAVRLRIRARLASGDAARAEEAVALAEDSLGYRRDSRSILLRAEAAAAAGNHLALFETLNALIDELDPREPSMRALVQRASELGRATPDDPDLRVFRATTLRRLDRLISSLRQSG